MESGIWLHSARALRGGPEGRGNSQWFSRRECEYREQEEGAGLVQERASVSGQGWCWRGRSGQNAAWKQSIGPFSYSWELREVLYAS